MSRDFDDICKKIDQSHKDLYKQDVEMVRDLKSIGKDNEKIVKELADVKKQVKDIGTKVDIMLEILNSFTIMLAEDDEDLEENYDFDNDNDETWVPKEDDFWEDDNDESI
jgi:uncharacterized Zn finger protein